ncbi:MAG TPA: ABC transporter permease subunit, partial [Candidatus Limnocylindrales bacterium]|nr:ABC transporter permease subunit [Candidatus Limnocylindrales bacterium]
MTNISASEPLVSTPHDLDHPAARSTLHNAMIITRREVRDSFRDWRIIGPIVVLTFAFPFLAQFFANQLTGFVGNYGANIIADRTIPFLLMIVGFFPISISLVIALETFVGEKERRTLEPLLSTPLTNTELYIGKSVAAMVPPLVASYAGMAVYLFSLLFGALQWRPATMLVVQIVLLTTVQALLMVTGAVVVSSQTTSTRAANLLASFIIIPMAAMIWLESAIMFLAPDAESPNGISALWAIIIGVSMVVLLLLRLGNSVFNREELLGRQIDSINVRGWFRQVGKLAGAKSLFEWYRHGIPASLGRLRMAVLITTLVFLAALVVGVVIGLQPQWQLPLPQGVDFGQAAGNIDQASALVFGTGGPLAIFMQNWQVLALASVFAVFTFGSMALVITPAVYLIIGYVLTQMALAGYSPLILIPAIVVHGVIE